VIAQIREAIAVKEFKTTILNYRKECLLERIKKSRILRRG